MADLPAAQANTMLTAAFTPATPYALSLHTASPGTTGANEVSGGGYARQTIEFGIPSGGSQISTDSQSFTTSLAPTVTSFGVWTTGGTYLGGGQLTSPVTAAAITVAIGAISFSVS